MREKTVLKAEKRIIGRKDKIDFPSLKVFDIDVKIDTGAYTGAIHCHNIEFTSGNNGEMVRFNLLDPEHSDYNKRSYILPVHRIKQVKSSTGNTEMRVFIKTEVILFGETFLTELSLTDRSDMRYPVLLGRKLLKKRFLVDVSRINISYRKKQKLQKKEKHK